MSSFHCKNCGRFNPAGGVPESKLHFLIPDMALDVILERIKEAFETEDPDASVLFALETGGVETLVCGHCGCLRVEGDGELAGTYCKL